MDDGKGGLWSDGDIWPLGFRPGWDDDRNLPVGRAIIPPENDDPVALP